MAIDCFRCRKPTTLDTKVRRNSYARSGRTFCSPTCRDATIAEESSIRMAATNRRFASARMKARNPMRFAKNREKMATTLRAIGHRPSVHGRNGRAVPTPQALLARELGWPVEVIIATGLRGSSPERYPTHYKLDIAHDELHVAIEVDGASHQGKRRILDAKKDRFLRERGWTVFRFKNEQVLWNVRACAIMVRRMIR